jgi:hypothetical protein
MIRNIATSVGYFGLGAGFGVGGAALTSTAIEHTDGNKHVLGASAAAGGGTAAALGWSLRSGPMFRSPLPGTMLAYAGIATATTGALYALGISD